MKMNVPLMQDGVIEEIEKYFFDGLLIAKHSNKFNFGRSSKYN